MVMIRVNIFEVKARLSEYLDRASRGERIVICRHNKPVAELRPLEEPRAEPRPLGPLPGRPTFTIPASFFEPLPADELSLWEGGEPEAASPPAAQRKRARVGRAARRGPERTRRRVRR
jgi:prevent-host-death family protein